MSDLQRIVREEAEGFNWRVLLPSILLKLLPLHAGRRLRPTVLRLFGFDIGRGTVMLSTPTITGHGSLHKLLKIGNYCWFNTGVMFDLGAEITIADKASLGQDVVLMTNSHYLGDTARRSGPMVSEPITVEGGAWLGTRSTILPGVTVGEGAVVAAGAMVTEDVAPHTVVGGVPAKLIRKLSGGQEEMHRATGESGATVDQQLEKKDGVA